jgi:hypothetical protein
MQCVMKGANINLFQKYFMKRFLSKICGDGLLDALLDDKDRRIDYCSLLIFSLSSSIGIVYLPLLLTELRLLFDEVTDELTQDSGLTQETLL